MCIPQILYIIKSYCNKSSPPIYTIPKIVSAKNCAIPKIFKVILRVDLYIMDI